MSHRPHKNHTSYHPSFRPSGKNQSPTVDQQNVDHDTMRLLKEIQSLMARYRIGKMEQSNLREIKADDLQPVGYMFLDGPDMMDTKIAA